jgi:hypothetical protein
VACDELQGRADVVVPFVVARPSVRPACWRRRRRGLAVPTFVVERWAEALTTLAWQACWTP